MRKTLLILGVILGLFALGCSSRSRLADTWRLLGERRGSAARLAETVRMLKPSHNGMINTVRLLKNSGEGLGTAYRTLFHGFLGPYSWDELYGTGVLLKQH
ncbi:MAG: hypothetical protein V3T77_00330 [Planctomycetota bacterium]